MMANDIDVDGEDHQQRRKLQHKWMGPFRVLGMKGNNAAVLELPPELKIHPVVNVSRLKKSRVDKLRPAPRPPPFKTQAGAHGTVEVREVLEVLDARKATRKKGWEYLLRWEGSAGFDEEEEGDDLMSWEHESACTGCAEAVADYWAKAGGKPGREGCAASFFLYGGFWFS